MDRLSHYQQGGENGFSVSLVLTPGVDGTVVLSAAVIPGSKVANKDSISEKFCFTPKKFGSETEDIASYVYDLIVDQLDAVGYRYCDEQQRAIDWIGRLVKIGETNYYCQDEDDEDY